MVSNPIMETRRAARIIVLALIIAPLGAMKLAILPGTGPFGVDGAFYVNAARNVQVGVGLQTSISMYHYGHTELPTPSRLIYPLWPLTVGYTARLVGLFPAVNYLPPLFYVLDLILLYFLAQRISLRMWGAANGVITPAHLLVLTFGVNFMFFLTTTYPYTEGLGFFITLSALLLFDRAAVRLSTTWGAIAGLAAGFALLTRTQLVIVGLAMLLVAMWTAVSDRRALPFAGAFSSGFGAVFIYWYCFVFHVRESPRVSLPAFRMWLETSTLSGWIGDRLEGVIVSFSLFSRQSYFESLHAAFLLPILAGLVGLVRWLPANSRSLRLRAEHALPACCVLVALGTYASLNLYHQDPEFLVPWLFGYRHGLPMIFGIAIGTVYLWRLGLVARAAVIGCFVVAIVGGSALVVSQILNAPRGMAPTAAEVQLAAWLDAHPSPPAVLTARPQYLSVYTYANIYWTECRTPAQTTRVMLEKLPIDYVVVYAVERRCDFISRLGDLLEERIAFGEGDSRLQVLTRKGGGTREGS
jgi:hypothetical protein